MKWKNKGHEFDDLGSNFQKNKKILILGENPELIRNKLDFIDFNSINIMSIKKLLIPFYSLLIPKHSTIVVANDSMRLYKKLLKNQKFKKEINIFTEEEFFNKYLSIYSIYTSNKVYFPSISFICTTICNLNCTDCLNFTPYNKNKKHIDINELKEDIDSFFRVVDKVNLFHISGGEPLLYPNLYELVEYINERYSHKINTLGITVNGSIVPEESLLKLFNKCNVKIYLDDYRIGVPRLEKTFNEALKRFKEYKLEIEIFFRDKFFQFFPPVQSDENLSENDLCQKFNACANPFTQLIDRKLFNCNWSNFAASAGLYEVKEEEFFDLNIDNISEDFKKTVIEYRLGYSEKGYVDFCKYCNGSWNICKKEVKAARQTKGLLVWDKSSPTVVKNLEGENVKL